MALGDVDGDGLCDIYLCRLEGPNVLYRNLGNWRFEDITRSAGPIAPDQISRGAAFADLDGDGNLDLILTSRGGGVRAFHNDGKAHFTEITAEAGLTSRTGSTSVALADIDGDGALDLYVANFGVGSVLRDGGRISTRMVDGKPVVMGRLANRLKIIDGELVELGEPDVLYRNDGRGRFTPIPWEGGAFLDEHGKPVSTPWDFGLAVQMRDMNGDGYPDIYVCNDFNTPDRIWINNGQGVFRAIDRLAIRKTSFASMGVDFADLDRDGRMDFLVVEMLSLDPARRLREMTPDKPMPPFVGRIDNRPQTGRNTLFWQRGDGTYAEIANFAGLSASDWSWMPVFLDVDLDGFEDVLIPNGQTHNLLDLDTIEQQRVSVARAGGTNALRFPRVPTPNRAFRNRGDLTFEEVGRLWGFDCPQVSNGMALADLDNDGDLDVVVNCLNAPALLLRNDSVAPRVAVRLTGVPPNTQGIGALIRVTGGAVASQTQEIIAGGRYLSADQAMRVFAAGSPTNDLTLEVTWRSGRRSVIAHAKPNHVYVIDEPASAPGARPRAEQAPTSGGGSPPAVVPRPYFEDVSELIAHRHVDEPFDDMTRQPLLPKRLSQLGPGVAWYDLDGDGNEDLVIGGGRGGRLDVYLNDGNGRFTHLPTPAAPLSADLAGLVGLLVTNRPSLLAGVSSYETLNGAVPAAWRIGLSPGATPAVSVWSTIGNPLKMSVGPLAVADIDGDGDLDVFIGGRVIPGRYPEAASSLILRNDDGVLRPDPENCQTLAGVGLVSGAVFSDLDGDGLPELILACEWGPIRVFKNSAGRFTEATRELGLAQYSGWWQGVTTGDLDGDGQMDIVAGNWGLNGADRCSEQSPLELYYGDFGGNGVVDILEASFDPRLNQSRPRRNWRSVGAGFPSVLSKFSSYKAFSEAGIADILGDQMSKAAVLRADTLASMVFLRRGPRFEAVPLPREAQWAPIFGVCVADLDGDGNEDVFVSQNFFDLPSETLRLDAGRGLWLRGDGRGGLAPVPGEVSGIRVYGEQRGCAVGDFDADGRVDLVVTQNGAATKLYRNVGAAPGLRLRLQGPPGNPGGVGAVLRAVVGQSQGPAKEVHAGSGYWSQDGAVQVVGGPAPPSAIRVRWPGGGTTETTIPAGARSVALDARGHLRVER